MKPELNQRIMERGQKFFDAIKQEKVSVFDRQSWLGNVMDWCMKDPHFKVQLLRFIDLFPMLSTPQSLQRHIEEYFGRSDQLPAVMRAGAFLTSRGGPVGAKLLQRFIRRNIIAMGSQFIVGETVDSALANLDKLRQQGFAFTIDQLGEATLSEQDAHNYCQQYLELIDQLGASQQQWHGLNSTSDLDWGYAPKINVSIKLTSLCPNIKPHAFEASVAELCRRLEVLVDKIIEVNGHLCLDMEDCRYKEIILEVYRRLVLRYRHYPHLSMAIQAYLKHSEQDLELLLTWAEQHQVHIGVRLVKGAYWDYEQIIARQNGWPDEVFASKHETDACFERMAEQVLRHSDRCYLACASHNIRSICAVEELARELTVPSQRYEFQVLYGMAEPIRRGLLTTTGRVRLYAPYGKMVPGMAYLVRRLLENSSNESFLRQRYAEDVPIEQLLQDPGQLGSVAAEEPPESFRNEPTVNFSHAKQRQQFATALAQVPQQFGRHYPLWLGTEAVTTRQSVTSCNPADPTMEIGRVSQADTSHIPQAIHVAERGFELWSATPVEQRCHILLTAAELMRQQRYALAALQVYEAGKQWDQAYADVTEAIDFLGYYVQQMRRLANGQPYRSLAGEQNHGYWRPKGITGVIAPWNFPLAISCGMVAAALVTGNSVIYKPSNLTPVIGARLVELLRQAGLPPEALVFLPGSGSRIGQDLIGHPQVAQIAFTGSMEVGLQIVQQAHAAGSSQTQVKSIIAEMGGKNAIIVDDDADLDEVIPAIIASAFSYQGQKCSACSRVIAVETMYQRLVERLIERVEGLTIGPACDPVFDLGPVIDATAVSRLNAAVERAKQQAALLYYRSPLNDPGYYPPLAIFGDVSPEHELAQQELFGPVLAVMRVKDFATALTWANRSRFALTAGVFSRCPSHLIMAQRQLLAGNIYINRGITGALVGRQPFGGFKLSGLGTKAGGPDYLHHFMHHYCVTENTMRRGFAPQEL